MDSSKLRIIEELLKSPSSDEDIDSTSTESSSSDPEEHSSVTNFLLTIESYSEKDFKMHFRLKRSTALNLIEMYKTSEMQASFSPGGRRKIEAEKEIYIFLWYMSNTESFRTISNLFGICKSSAWNVINRVSKWLISIGHNYIKWPQGDEIATAASQFEKKKKIPGVIGAIDCSHIRIKAPSKNAESYFNRKHYYSIHLQAIVDANKKFIDVYCGEPGSLHDNRVLRRSPIYRKVDDNFSEWFPNGTFIIGDSAYPTLNWIISPFKDNGSLTRGQQQFNYIHSSTRMVVENAFGLLKTRFRRLLHFTEQNHLNFVVNLTVCGCILHNICIIENDTIEMEIEQINLTTDVQDDNSHDCSIPQNVDRRQNLYNDLVAKNIIVD